jgi:Ca2+-dependent lipid-binding protein
MLKKGSTLYSILTGSCPKCHEESMYIDKNPYNISEIYEMHETCSHCKTHYKIEPSFFYGAMYVSYALGIAFAVAAFIISYVFIGTNLKVAFLTIIGTLVLFMPIIMRLSRNIWINFFISYDKNWKNSKKED